jgi:Uma2 family endonuclease
MWLGSYEEQTPGVEVLVDSTVILGPKSEVQPDAILRLLPEFGGRSRIIENYVHQAPEFVLEVSKATRYHDLGPKLKIYELADVLEYVVIAIDPDEIRWFRLEKGVMTEQSAGTDSLYRSSVFPGLWLDPSALIAGDTKRQRDVVSAGCETPEHADFVAKLARARASR